jgi:hypothetical protein
VSPNNPEGHSPRYWRKHPSAKSKVEAEVKVKPRTAASGTEEKGSLWRWWELAAVIFGLFATLEITAIFRELYWPSVVVVYIGLVLATWGGYKGKWSSHVLGRLLLSGIGITALCWWTFGVVLVRVPLVIDSKQGVDGIRVYLDSPTRFDLKDVDLEVSVDGLITNISQLSAVCQGFNYFPEDRPTYLDTSAGRVFPADKSWSNKARVVCEKIPRESIVTLVVGIFTTDLGNPKNPFPQMPMPTVLLNGVALQLTTER